MAQTEYKLDLLHNCGSSRIVAAHYGVMKKTMMTEYDKGMRAL